jgi:hypothetical protein
MHHVVPRSRGGTRTVPLCERCHGLVHDRTMNTRALTKAALAVKKAKGQLVGAVPYGWQLAADGVQLERCEAEQAVIAEVLSMRARGLTLRAIGTELTRQGITPRNGGRWHPVRVFRVQAADGGSWHAKQVSRIVEAGRLS